MKSKKHIIKKLIDQENFLINSSNYPKYQKTKLTRSFKKMLQLLTQYDVQNKFLNKKVQQLIIQNHNLKFRKSNQKRDKKQKYILPNCPLVSKTQNNILCLESQTQIHQYLQLSPPSRDSINFFVPQFHFCLNLQSPNQDQFIQKQQQQKKKQLKYNIQIKENPQNQIQQTILVKSFDTKLHIQSQIKINEKQKQISHSIKTDQKFSQINTSPFLQKQQYLIVNQSIKNQKKYSKKRYLSLVSKRNY